MLREKLVKDQFYVQFYAERRRIYDFFFVYLRDLPEVGQMFKEMSRFPYLDRSNFDSLWSFTFATKLYKFEEGAFSFNQGRKILAARIKLLEKAVKEDPGHMNARLELAFELQKRGDVAASESVLADIDVGQQAFPLQTRMFYIHVSNQSFLAVQLLKQGRKAEAVAMVGGTRDEYEQMKTAKVFERAVDPSEGGSVSQRNFEAIHANLAFLYFLIGEYEKTIVLREEILKRDPLNVDSVLFKSMSLVLMGEEEAAIDYLKQCCDSSDRDATFVQVYSEMAMFTESDYAVVRKNLQTHPNPSELYYIIALARATSFDAITRQDKKDLKIARERLQKAKNVFEESRVIFSATIINVAEAYFKFVEAEILAFEHILNGESNGSQKVISLYQTAIETLSNEPEHQFREVDARLSFIRTLRRWGTKYQAMVRNEKEALVAKYPLLHVPDDAD